MIVPGSVNPLLLASAAAAGGLQVSRSLRFNSADSASLSRASYAGSGTFSCWVKRCKLGSAQTIINGVAFNASDQLNSSTAVFRDPSAYMHILVSSSGTYVNNSSVASGSSITPGVIGSGCDIYLADVYFIDGQNLTPSSFTETDATTGQLIPKAYSGSYGTNGFYLQFADNSSNTASTLGKDYSGLGNNWTPNNLSVTAGAGNDSLVDVPTNGAQTDTGVGGEVRGCYCTLNPLISVQALTLVNGNLETASPGAAWRNAKGTFGMASGKWYWEHTVPTTGAADGYIGGVATAAADYSSSSTGIWGRQGTTKYSNGSSSTPFGSTTSGDILGFAFDADAGKLWVAQNGTWVGDPAAGTGESWSGIPSGVFPYVAAYNQANVVNFGQRLFAYTNGRSGFKALCTTNLPSPLVTKPSTVMDVKLYTGNGSTQTISGLQFNPDFLWIKNRDTAGYNHHLTDAVRGVTQRLRSNTTGAELTTTDQVTAYTSSGFTLGADSAGPGDLECNQSSKSYVAWAWDAGTSTVTNNNGSISSSVRANPTAGFSIVTYTGNGSNATVGHGLGIAPSMAIVKVRNRSGDNWLVYHKSLATPSTDYLLLSSTAASGTLSGYWNGGPTSSVIGLGNYSAINNIGDTYVAYCFAPVVGYSSFGTFVPTGTTDSSFVYCGFRPRLLLVKQTSNSSNWITWDTARDSYNYASKELYPNLSDAEVTNSSTYSLDILSNGFKMRNPGMSAGSTWIYCAWAEAPFNYSRAR